MGTFRVLNLQENKLNNHELGAQPTNQCFHLWILLQVLVCHSSTRLFEGLIKLIIFLPKPKASNQ